MKRNVLNSPRLWELQKSRRRGSQRKIFVYIFSFIIIFSVLVYLTRISSLNIKNIEISGNKILEQDVIKADIDKTLAGNYLWLIPKTNILFYPKSKINLSLTNDFKRLSSVSLTVKTKSTLSVVLSERTAMYTWCGDSKDLGAKLPSGVSAPKSELDCYFMDQDGYIFDQAPYFSGDVYFKFYGKQTNSNFSPKYFSKIISLIGIFKNLGLKPFALETASSNDVIIYLSSQHTKNIRDQKIIFKLDGDYQKIEENLSAVLNVEPLKYKFSSTEYIDLRFGNKIYYKFFGAPASTNNPIETNNPITPSMPLTPQQ